MCKALSNQTVARFIFVELECRRDEMEKRMTDPSRKAFGKLNSLTQFQN